MLIYGSMTSISRVTIGTWYVPKDGHTVTVRVIPQGGGGGGKNPLRTILTLAVVAASFYFAPGLGASLASSFGAAGAGSTVFGSLTYQGLAGALLTVGGTLLVNAIAPIRPPSLSGLSGSGNRESPTLFIEGARNAARPFGTVPIVLGKHRHVPPLGVTNYTEVKNGDSFLKMLVVWGYGPLKIENVKIGDTPIANFDGVTIENREGRSTDAAHTIINRYCQANQFVRQANLCGGMDYTIARGCG